MNDLLIMLRHLLTRKLALIISVPRRLQQEYDFLRRGIFVASGSFIERGTKIGNRTRINAPSHLGRCEIGAYCAIGGRLIVRSANHVTSHINMQDFSQKHFLKATTPVAGVRKSDVRIGNGVWIGDSVIILPGVRVGNGAVIGAGSVVNKDIPDYSVAVGNPARVVKMRFSEEVCEKLQEIRWWEWSEKKIKKNRWFFDENLRENDSIVLSKIRKIQE